MAGSPPGALLANVSMRPVLSSLEDGIITQNSADGSPKTLKDSKMDPISMPTSIIAHSQTLISMGCLVLGLCGIMPSILCGECLKDRHTIFSTWLPVFVCVIFHNRNGNLSL